MAYAFRLFRLLSSRKDHRTGTFEKHIELIGKQPIFGFFVDGEEIAKKFRKNQ